MTSRETRWGHPADFRVRYRFFPQREGGRAIMPLQGYRSDFSYEGDDPAKGGLYMIHPEFEGIDGRPIPEEARATVIGTARMWIVIHEMREEVHRKRVTVGTRGFFMEGGRCVAEAEVIEILGLHTNEGERLDSEG